ncbi:hypothetical protein GCM10023231_12480 [Olivibacter ginsenosidimutans]|uniref:Uncharacterized protein n=1 Tax=Olivibacter ginsenosidimutans TaxID=1176537 RepID=A0ABP9AUC8_9SPHI
MELRKIHSTVIEVMKDRGSFVPEQEVLLSLIGSWYHKWLTLGGEELVLKIPYYHKEIMPSLIEYHYWLDLLIKIMAVSKVSDLSDSCLFDVRTYRLADRTKRYQTEFSIEYRSSNSRLHRFDKDINVSVDRFLPLFTRDQINGYKEIVANVFDLMKAMGRENLIPYAVKFDLENDVTLFVKQTTEHFSEKAFAKMLCTEDFRNDDDQRDAVLDALLETDIRRCIVFTYPYHVDVSSAVVNEFRGRSKICRISLSNRFAHTEVEAQELILTRAEIGFGKQDDILNVTDRFSIKKTGCGAELITGLRALRYEWNVAKFNSFSNPFPVKWLLCVHPGYTVDQWKVQFKNDYPDISGQLLLDCWRIIELVYEVNWIDRFLPTDQNATLVLPKSTIHNEVIFSLQEQLNTRFKDVIFADEIDQELIVNGRVYLLDPFNVILLNNITLCGNPENFHIVVPDFLFYTYQPFTRYLALKYHFDALTGGLREHLDERFPECSSQWKTLSETVLRSSKKELREFNSILAINDEEEQMDNPSGIVADLSAAELVERVVAKERKSIERTTPEHLYIHTSTRKLVLRPNAPVLINQNGTLIRTIAAVLDTNVLFVPLDDVIKNMDLKLVVDRLVTLSDDARNWHQNLKSLEEKDVHIFDRLKQQGLSISKQTFEKDYLYGNRSLGELHMPRAKRDWVLICERLRIKDSLTAWNVVKCREDINLLKSVYSEIIALMIDTGSFGVNVSDRVLDQITALISKLPDSAVNTKENQKDAIVLINEICEKINLEKIEQINPIAL